MSMRARVAVVLLTRTLRAAEPPELTLVGVTDAPTVKLGVGVGVGVGLAVAVGAADGEDDTIGVAVGTPVGAVVTVGAGGGVGATVAVGTLVGGGAADAAVTLTIIAAALTPKKLFQPFEYARRLMRYPPSGVVSGTGHITV
jgi:hypothetical protein